MSTRTFLSTCVLSHCHKEEKSAAASFSRCTCIYVFIVSWSYSTEYLRFTAFGSYVIIALFYLPRRYQCVAPDSRLGSGAYGLLTFTIVQLNTCRISLSLSCTAGIATVLSHAVRTTALSPAVRLTVHWNNSIIEFLVYFGFTWGTQPHWDLRCTIIY